MWAILVEAVLRIRIRDSVPSLPLDTGSRGMGKKIKIRIWDEHPGSISESLETIFWVKNT
jgi:hypothetical protein